jgi:hypothetical protein
MPSTFYDMRRMARGKQLGRDELLLVRIFPSFHPLIPTGEEELVPTARQPLSDLWDLWVANGLTPNGERRAPNTERLEANPSCGSGIFSLDCQPTMHQELC